MNKEPFLSLFLVFSFFLHTVLAVYFIVDPFSNFRSKKNILIPQTIRVRTVDFAHLSHQIDPKNKDNKALPMKEKTSLPLLDQARSEQKSAKKVPLIPNVLEKKPKKKAKPKPKKSQPTNKKSAQERKNKQKKDIQKQQKQALEKLSALQSIEKIKKELAQGAATNLLAGSRANQEVNQSQLDFFTLQYFARLKAHINMYWNLPQELADKELRTQVHAEIDRTGRVLSGKILKPSGNEDFDARVLETINRASPFPPPPTKEIEKLLSKGLVFNFPK